MKNIIYIKNISNQVTFPLLYELLIQTSPIKKLKYKQNNISDSKTTNCTVIYHNVVDADYAYYVLNNTPLYDSRLQFFKAKDENEIKLVIKGVGNYNEKKLLNLFSVFGYCTVRVIDDNIGFVLFYDVEIAKNAVFELTKRKSENGLNIEFSKQKNL